MIIADPATSALQRSLDRLASTDMTVLVLGETGTGKELVARYLHANSARRDGPFIAVNCGALTSGLGDAELFGHEKGAFTGAIKDQTGWFEAAEGGTILLDEIGDLPLNLQVKLLRVLQEREVIPVGSRRAVPVNARVLAATNVDLRAAVQEKLFREDLFYRLNVACVPVPPLRQRRAEIAPLARHFADICQQASHAAPLQLGRGVIEALEQHTWPGNIRELENVIRYAAHIAEGSTIRVEDLALGPVCDPSAARSDTLDDRIGIIVSQAILAGEGDILDRTISSTVRSAFEMSGSNQVHTAAMLGTTRNSVRTQLARLGIIEPRRRERSGSSRLAEINIGYQKYGASSLLRSKGTLEQRLTELGIDVAWKEFVAGPQMLKALEQGAIDFGTTGEAPPIFAQAAGVPLVYLAYDPPSPKAEAIVVHADSNLRDLSDLKGRRIGLNYGSNVQYLLVRALQKAGISLSDIIQIDIPPDQPPLGWLENGAIDAWCIWDPMLSAVLRSGNLRLLADGSGLAPNRQFYLGRRPYVSANPQTIDVLLKELQVAGEQAVQQAGGTARRLAQEVNITVPALEESLRRMTFGVRPIDRIVVAEQQLIADTLYMAQMLSSPVLISDALLTY
jgi:aliphatic sulfonates family ABC transporter substrate-binding protein